MLVHPQFSPVAFSVGDFAVHWYGLMYLIGFGGGLGLGVLRARRPGNGWRAQQVWDMTAYIIAGVIIGGRLGYCLFYNFAWYARHPLEIFFVWQGGMSFHGGLLGVAAGVWLFARISKRGAIAVADFLAPLVPVGLFAGRLGNFINQELWGRPTDLPWGMVFPAVDSMARHASQLYEAALEGVVLFVLLWVYSARPRAAGKVLGMFLIAYGVLRFIVEFAREPDAHLQFIAFQWLTMGQLLSVPMVAAGLYFFFFHARCFAGRAKR